MGNGLWQWSVLAACVPLLAATSGQGQEKAAAAERHVRQERIWGRYKSSANSGRTLKAG
jgi:hypothetical protein